MISLRDITMQKSKTGTNGWPIGETLSGTNGARVPRPVTSREIVRDERPPWPYLLANTAPCEKRSGDVQNAPQWDRRCLILTRARCVHAIAFQVTIVVTNGRQTIIDRCFLYLIFSIYNTVKIVFFSRTHPRPPPP